VHVEKSIKKGKDYKPLDNSVYNALLRSKPAPITYEDFKNG
jgi:hypothetical protein